MIDDEQEPVIVFSSLGGRYTRQDVTVEVHIYRGENESDWILEVQDPQGGSTLWDDRFDSDKAALAEFRRALNDEGIQSFVVDERKLLHKEWANASPSLRLRVPRVAPCFPNDTVALRNSLKVWLAGHAFVRRIGEGYTSCD